MESLFQDHRLDAKALASDRFTQVINGFQNENKSFPLTRKLAELWATGGSDEALQKAWAQPLRTAMQHYILPNADSGEMTHFENALLVSVTNLDETISTKAAKENGKEILQPDFYTLDKAKRELELLFSSEEQPVADFLAAFLKANCVYGIEPKQPLAPTENEATVASSEKSGTGTETIEAIAAVIPATGKPVQSENISKQHDSAVEFFFSNQLTRSIIAAAALALGLILVFLLCFRWIRRGKKGIPPLPASKANEVVEPAAQLSSPADFAEPPAIPGHAEIEFWRNRALEAERRLETVSATTRSHLMPHLARMLMDKFVQRLFSQRTVLLDTQEMATLKVVEMEKQLEKIHASRESQLKAYQLRIEQLEKELAAKAEENRALIRTTMQLTERGL